MNIFGWILDFSKFGCNFVTLISVHISEKVGKAVSGRLSQ